MAKSPKKNYNPSTEKVPKAAESPAEYKNYYVAWQLNTIDLGGEWSVLSFKNKFKFSFTEGLMEDLSSDIPNALFETLDELDNKEFTNRLEFIEKLINKSQESLTIQDIKIIFKHLSETLFWNDVFPKLKNLEKSTWNEIERQTSGKKGKSKHHSVKVSEIIPEAQKRLSRLKLNDFEELFSMRLTGELRLWGIRQYNYLQILWIDPNHEICPSLKKHT